MKYAIAIATLLSTSAASAAELGECQMLGDVSRMVMEYRQREQPVSALMRLVESVPGTKSQKHAFKMLVIHAYKLPSHTNEQAVQRAVDEFGNEMELACIHVD